MNNDDKVWISFDDDNEVGYWIEDKMKAISDFAQRVPVNCPVCSLIMNGAFDTQSYFKYKSCEKCYIQFIEGREDKWIAGIRPTEVELSRFIEKRKKFF